MVARTVPEALRRGLTFWRRSIQARVVVSTVLLSAIVVAGVGWFLLRQVEQGLVDERVDAVLSEVGNENSQAESSLKAATETNAATQVSQLLQTINSSGQVRGFHVVLTGDDGGYTVRRDERAVPASLRSHFASLDRRGDAADASVDVHHVAAADVGRQPRGLARHRRRHGDPDPGGRQHAHGLLPVPARRRGADAGLGDPGPADRRRPAAGPDRGAHLVADPPDRHPDPARPAGRGAARGRSAAGAVAGDRRGRPRPPGDVVQPDGDQPAAPDPAAGGAQPGAATLRLRRVPRAPHAADDGPARRLGPPRGAQRLRPADRALGRAPPVRARPLRDAPGGPARDQQVRCGRGRPRPRRRQPHRCRTPGRRGHAVARRAARHPDRRPRARDRRAWPRPTYAGWSGSCATS